MEELSLEECVQFQDLPPDILLSIAQEHGLNVRDIASLMCTCRELRDLYLGPEADSLWRSVYNSRYLLGGDSLASLPYRQRCLKRAETDGRIRKLVRRLPYPHESHSHLTQILANQDDAFDVLRRDSALPPPGHEQATAHVGRAFWSHVALSALVNERCRAALSEIVAAERLHAQESRSRPSPASSPPKFPFEAGPLVVAEAFCPTEAPLSCVTTYLTELAVECARRMEEHPRGPLDPATSREALEVLNGLLFQERPSEAYAKQRRDRGLHPFPSWLPVIPRGHDAGGIGLTGNSHLYYVKDNSFLHRVLETGLGLPITLCVIHAAVAQRLGMPVHLVNLPMHVYCRFDPDSMAGREVFVDCFDNGKLMTREQVRDALSLRGLPGLSLDDGPVWTEPMTSLQTCSRMLNNLSRLFVNSAQGLLTVNTLSSGLHPEDVTFVLKQAQIHLMSEDPEAAEAVLDLHGGLLSARPEYSHVAGMLREAIRRGYQTREKVSESVRRRTSSRLPLRFHVGDVVRTTKPSGSSIGVVSGWNSEWGPQNLYEVLVVKEPVTPPARVGGAGSDSQNPGTNGTAGQRTASHLGHSPAASLPGAQVQEVNVEMVPLQEASLQVHEGLAPGNPPPGNLLRCRQLGQFFDRWNLETQRFEMNGYTRFLYPEDHIV